MKFRKEVESQTRNGIAVIHKSEKKDTEAQLHACITEQFDLCERKTTCTNLNDSQSDTKESDAQQFEDIGLAIVKSQIPTGGREDCPSYMGMMETIETMDRRYPIKETFHGHP